MKSADFFMRTEGFSFGVLLGCQSDREISMTWPTPPIRLAWLTSINSRPWNLRPGKRPRNRATQKRLDTKPGYSSNFHTNATSFTIARIELIFLGGHHKSNYTTESNRTVKSFAEISTPKLLLFGVRRKVCENLRRVFELLENECNWLPVSQMCA